MKTVLSFLTFALCLSVFASNDGVASMENRSIESYVNQDSTFVPDTSAMNVLVAYNNGELSIVPLSNYSRCFVMIEKCNSDVVHRELIDLSKGTAKFDYDLGNGNYSVSIYSTQGRFHKTITVE